MTLVDETNPAEKASIHRVEVFSAPSEAPLVRWRTDLLSAGFIAALLVFLIIVAGEGSTLDRNTLEFVGQLPDWLLWLCQAAYVVGVLYALSLLIGVGLFARDRLDVLRDMVLAVVFAAVVVLVLTRFIDERWPEFAFFELDETANTFPAVFLTAAAATQASSVACWSACSLRQSYVTSSALLPACCQRLGSRLVSPIWGSTSPTCVPATTNRVRRLSSPVGRQTVPRSSSMF